MQTLIGGGCVTAYLLPLKAPLWSSLTGTRGERSFFLCVTVFFNILFFCLVVCCVLWYSYILLPYFLFYHFWCRGKYKLLVLALLAHVLLGRAIHVRRGKSSSKGGRRQLFSILWCSTVDSLEGKKITV